MSTINLYSRLNYLVNVLEFLQLTSSTILKNLTSKCKFYNLNSQIKSGVDLNVSLSFTVRFAGTISNSCGTERV